MRYFLCNIVPREYLVKYHIPTAAFNFCDGLISANSFDKVYSILPSNVYNYNEKKECDQFSIVYSSIRGKSKLSRVIACWIEQIKIFNGIKRNSVVWLYNLAALNALLVILLRWFKPSVKICTIVLDFTPEDKQNKFYLPLINKSFGLIKLSDSELFTVKNSICLPGVVDSTKTANLLERPLTPDFLLSGNVKEQIAMLSMILPAFSKMPSYNLHICGHVHEEDKINAYTVKCANIKNYGLMEYEDYLKLLDRCPFMLSTRDPKEPRNQCNFPSKIMEGLNNNKIIISTIHYNQLDGIEYIEVPSTINEFINAINTIVSMPENELMKYANQADKAKMMFNADVWKECFTKIENNGYGK